MTLAHTNTKSILARYKATGNVYNYSYRQVFTSCLKTAHKTVKRALEALQTSSRNLFKLFTKDTDKLAAFVTAQTADEAICKYFTNGGKSTVRACKVSIGYPKNECSIYA